MEQFKDKLEEAAHYGHLLHLNKLVIGAGGNLSVRDGDSVVIKKKMADMSEESVDNYLQIPFHELQKMEDPSLSSETPLHTSCYKAREDVGAVIHVHSPYVIAAAGKTELLESTSYEFDCVIEKDVPVVDYIQPGSEDLAAAVGKKIAEGANAVLMKKHGATTVGKNLEEAYLRMLALERACITFLL
jgi:L-fuculose-phosphate aldolase